MKRSVNITGIIGLVLALVLVIFVGIALNSSVDPATGKTTYSIAMTNMIRFVDIPSLAITVGGTIGGIVFMFPLSTLKKIPHMLGLVFLPPKYDPKSYINEMVEYCKVARMKGILQLEEAANECKDPFMKSALMLIVDANDSEKVQAMLDDSIDFMCERHEANFALWLKMSSSAPAFGMIGTLVGLINMLATLDTSGNGDGASNLGAGMSTALVTTFYGCVIAHILANPIANQLKYIHNNELLCMQIVEEGALAIISGANPRYVQEKLEMLLSEKEVKGKDSKSSAKKESTAEK